MNDFLKSISFTKKEIRIIVFSVSVLTIGLIIKHFNQIVSGETGKNYDYSQSDDKFRNYSLQKNLNPPDIYSDTGNSNEESSNDLMHNLLRGDDSIKSIPDSLKNPNENEIYIEPVNLNTATKEQLIELPGIGESTAEKILIYRDERKGFKNIEELMKIKGIGRKKFEKIKRIIKTG